MAEDERVVMPDSGDGALDTAAGGGQPDAGGRRRGRRRKLVISGIVIAVVAVVGIGFWQWHETPGFCTAICHEPMDGAYLDTLNANPYGPATDKWGNEVEYAGAMLASLHGKMGKRCMECHVPTLEEQVAEALSWVGGDYYNPPSERDLARLVAYRGVSEDGFCLNGACHDISKEGLTGLTAAYSRNPHSWHHDEYACGDCHKAHRASIMICTQCHDDAELPQGWLDWGESQDLGVQYLSWNQEQFIAGAGASG